MRPMLSDFPHLIRKIYESLLGRPMTEEEVAEYELYWRQMADFLIDCSKDDGLMRKMGITPLREQIDAPRPPAYHAESTEGGFMAVTTKKEPGAVGEITFTVQVFREGKMFVARAPELDVASAGETVEQAKVHLLEAVEAFLEEAQRMGTLTDILEEAGYERTAEGWKPPNLLAQERAKVVVPS